MVMLYYSSLGSDLDDSCYRSFGVCGSFDSCTYPRGIYL
jgi:hypothetical protein